MKIGYAGPITLESLPIEKPVGVISYAYPLGAALVRAFLEKEHEVFCFTSSGSIKETVVLKSNNHNLTVYVVPIIKRDIYFFYRKTRRLLSKVMRECNPDILHAHWGYEFAAATLDTGLSSVVTLRDHAWTIVKTQKPTHFWFARWIVNQVLVMPRVANLSANSDYLKSVTCWKKNHEIKVLSNFYRKDIRSFCGHNHERPSDTILTVVNGFSARKNVGRGLKAFSILRRKRPHLRYRLIGDGMQEGGPAWKYAKKHGVIDAVQFIGKKTYEETLKEISSANVLLHPALEESFGMTILEAMVLGTPVVGGKNSGNVPFLLEQGKAGILCDVTSPEDMCRSVERLLDDQSLRLELSAHAQKMAEEKYSEENVVEEYIAYYRKILSADDNRIN